MIGKSPDRCDRSCKTSCDACTSALSLKIKRHLAVADNMIAGHICPYALASAMAASLALLQTRSSSSTRSYSTMAWRINFLRPPWSDSKDQSTTQASREHSTHEGRPHRRLSLLSTGAVERSSASSSSCARWRRCRSSAVRAALWACCVVHSSCSASHVRCSKARLHCDFCNHAARKHGEEWRGKVIDKGGTCRWLTHVPRRAQPRRPLSHAPQHLLDFQPPNAH